MGDLSCVAVIVGGGGSTRVVITPEDRLGHHAGPDETVFVVDGLRVREPLPWHEAGPLVARVIEAVQAHLAGSR